MSNPSITPSVCERCGAEFGCGAVSGSCWCQQHTLNENKLALLRELYNNCICPDCMKALEEQDIEAFKAAAK